MLIGNHTSVKAKRALEYSESASKSSSIAIRSILIVAITGCALLLIWIANQASKSTQSDLQPVDIVVSKGTGTDLSIEVPPQSDRFDLMQRDIVSTGDDSGPAIVITHDVDQREGTFDKNDDYRTYSTIAQILSMQPGDDTSPPSEQALRQLQDKTIEDLVETDLAERYEQFTRLVDLQPQLDNGVITGLLVIPHGPPGVELLLKGGLLQNDIIISVNNRNFSSMVKPESLPGSFIVELLTAPSTHLGILRGGSETQVTFESGKQGNAPQ